ncbi:LA_2272 family surface repeat-containing protein [Flavobacterium kingsejongi]|uniref:Secretin/TonB short N-terminal domain-containing protein n=1 Tax=Flavobacterium kingsejongi TaxID=1678728 RepID=A0A2S1LRJ6_9FLAO|nr:hypothetical protein [Flavobacterium kingsejongi]AWG26390.1 hypothetical protein FK004_14715 [Flavobacterium kingsejongi]
MRSILRFFLFLFLISSTVSSAQSLLSKEISIKATGQSLGSILDLIEKRENFKFSYYSKLVPRDSIVSITADKISIKDVLDRLLDKRYEYRESSDFIILRYAPSELTLIVEKNTNMGDYYLVTGYVSDAATNKKLENATIYEKNVIQSVMTNNSGYFELHLKNIQRPIEITVSKENYKSITTFFLSEIIIETGPKKNWFDYYKDDFSNVERTGIGRFFISSRQKIQSLNLGGLIAKAPVQASLIPSIGTHGLMNAQMVNNFSLNLIGGYSGGVRGFEIAGLYNISKTNAEALQMAGLFNTVGGSVRGVQMAGIYNNAFGDLMGLQMSGIHNSVKGTQNGLQISGAYNSVGKNGRGMQLSAGYNNIRQSQAGMQLTFGYNRVRENAYGVQMGSYNYAGNLQGLQIGLVNVTGSTSGYSIGLLNFKKGGYKKVSFSSNEISDYNIAIKTGDNKFYTIIMAGKSERADEAKLFSFGFGFGKNIKLSKYIHYNPEVSFQSLYLGNWGNINILRKIDSPFTFRILKGLSVHAGPSFTLYTSDILPFSTPDPNATAFIAKRTDHLTVIRDKKLSGFRGWFGWSVGVTIF